MRLDDELRRLAYADTLLVCVDFDGTLAPIVSTPDAARALPGGAQALTALAALPATTVAVVSGRSRADLAALTALAGLPPEARLVGSHGAELDDSEPPGPADPAAARRLAAVVAEVQRIADGVPGVLVETKPASVAVHVRLAARDDAARVLQDVRHGPGDRDGVHLTAGHEVLELSVAPLDKGAAVEALRRTTGATAVLYVGDDVTDERALARLGPTDVGVRVGPGDTAAAHRVADPRAVAALLVELAQSRAAAVRGR